MNGGIDGICPFFNPLALVKSFRVGLAEYINNDSQYHS